MKLWRRRTARSSPSTPGSSHASSSVGFGITMWTYVAPVHRLLPPAEYAHALGRLHAGLRQTDVTMPHVMERVAETQRDVASRDITLTSRRRTGPCSPTRCVICGIDRRPARPEQLLHGGPHPWNVLDTNKATADNLRNPHPERLHLVAGYRFGPGVPARFA